MQSEARVATADGERYARQLCKHAGHMGPRVEWNPPVGTIDFPDNMGTCRLTVEPDFLLLELESQDSVKLEKMQDLLGSNIERFAFRENIKVAWSAADASQEPQSSNASSTKRTRLWNVAIWLPPAFAGLHVAMAVLAYIAVLAGFVGATRLLTLNPWIIGIGVAWGIGIGASWAFAQHRGGSRTRWKGH